MIRVRGVLRLASGLLVAALPVGACASDERRVEPKLRQLQPKERTAGTTMLGEEFYAWTGEAGGLPASMHGRRIDKDDATRLELEAAAPTQIGARSVLIGRTEYGWWATWIENDHAYVFEITCDPEEDPRCRDSTFISEMVAGIEEVPSRDEDE